MSVGGVILDEYCTRSGCGARLHANTNGNGGVVATCPPCERNKAGLCRDCPKPRKSRRSFRCGGCSEKHAAVVRRRTYENNRETVLARQREYRQRPDVRPRRLAYTRAYNAEYFADEIGRRAKIESTKRWRATPEGRAKHYAAKKKWEARHADELRAKRKQRYQANRDRYVREQRERRARARQERAA